MDAQPAEELSRVLKKTRIAGAVAALATGLLLVAAAPAQADTINQVNNIVPITFCGNNISVAVAAVAIPISGVLSPSTVTCSTAVTYQWG
jgi:hypothetical protein